MSFAISLVVIIVIVSFVWNRTSCTKCGGELRKVYKEKCEKLINYLYYPSFRTICWSNVVCGSDLIEKTNVESNGGV